MVSFPRDKFILKPAGLVKFSHDDELLVAGLGSDVMVAARGGQIVHELATPSKGSWKFAGTVWCVAIDRRSNLVAAGHEDGRVSVWSLDSGALLSRKNIFRGRVLGIEFVADVQSKGYSTSRFGRKAASGPLIAVCCGTTVTLLKAGDLRKYSTLSGGETQWPAGPDNLQTIAAERDGQYIVAGRRSGHVHVWEAAPGGTYELVRTLSLSASEGGAQRVLLHTDKNMSRTLYVAFDRVIRAWSIPDFAEVAAITTEGTKDIALCEEGQVIASAHLHSSCVRFWNLNGDMLRVEAFEDGIVGIAATRDGALLALRDDAGQLRRLRRG
jgi:WD40 repeat protein